MSKYFVSAIGTDSGKTLVSAILCEALGADYWKPVQSGMPRDTETVQQLVSAPLHFYQERYLLNTPASPHASAEIDGVNIKLSDFELPESEKLVVEGAGGLLVPLNNDDLIIDLIAQLNLPLILVSNLYLGSINHTLLSAKVLKQYGIPVAGIIFNGEPNPSSEAVILHQTGYRCLLKIPRLDQVNKAVVQFWANQLKAQL